MHEKKYTKYKGTPQGLQPQKKIKIQKHPAGFAATQKKTEAPKGFARKKYTKIQRHPAGFATTKKKLKYRSTPQGLQLHKKKKKKEKTEAPKGFALQKYTPRGLYCHYHTINENKSTPQGLHLQKCRSTPQGLQLQKYTPRGLYY